MATRRSCPFTASSGSIRAGWSSTRNFENRKGFNPTHQCNIKNNEGIEMIEKLKVINFKSVRSLDIECSKVNLFIGRPNSGKSNILEALGMFSLPYVYGNVNQLIRLESMMDLFYDHNIHDPITIRVKNDILKIEYKDGYHFVYTRLPSTTPLFDYTMNEDFGRFGSPPSPGPSLSNVKFYKFKIQKSFEDQSSSFLNPPYGDNLLSIIMSNKKLKSLVKDIFDEFGLRLVYKPHEKKIEVMKEIDDVIYSYPYSLISDTLQRLVFHLIAMETNQDSVLIFEEPEAHAFPYYTKYLAERIALDKTNQYFITTHNPYMLLSILEKTPRKDVCINITYFEDYQTKVKQLTDKEKVEVMDLNDSVFFNLEKFISKK
jgi:AAA15 family ATPase/GTPase